MDKQERNLREELTCYGRMMVERGLVFGPGGNISARNGDTMYISPSGFALDDINPDDHVPVDIPSGRVVGGGLRPSAGILKHLFCYRVRDDIQAVLHAHSPKTIALSCTDLPVLPLFPDFVVYLGERVPDVRYITPTTKELALAVADVIRDHNAVLMRNHGSITVGANLKEAFYRIETLEIAIGIQIEAARLGDPRALGPDECRAIKSLESEIYREELLKAARAWE